MGKSLKNLKIGFVGSGMMAEAIVSGVLSKGLVPASAICCADPYSARCEQLEERYGVKTTTNNKEAIKGADVVFLSIKPQVLNEVSKSLLGTFNDSHR